MSHSCVFPGQGSQFVGMGKEIFDSFPASRQVFEEVNDALKMNLSSLMFEGDVEELTATENTQPALFAVSMAVVRALEAEGGFALWDKISLCAGHSLGEYAALAAADVMNIADGASLLRLRGQAMQRAVPKGEGGMAAILGITFEDAQSLCEEAAQGLKKGIIIEIANDNGGGQIVLSGHKEGIERAMEIAKERGIRRVVPLPVSAPFHSSLMGRAAEEMKEALSEVVFKPAKIPVIANITAAPVESVEEIKEFLVQQITGRVRWRETVLSFEKYGITQQHELGAGKVLTGLGKRILPDLTLDFAGKPAEIEELLKKLG